jgi:ubiquinone/menaquinone biosynthesis C-methylase UbiE
VDWGEGRYEHIAAELVPAAELLVERLAPEPGEHAVDVGCGTGNAALLAARRGARVTGVDPAARLLELADAQARAEGLDAEFLQGEAAALPVEDQAADAVLSVFGVIFAPDAERAAAELARITAPKGRIALTAWQPGGAIGAMARMRGQALAQATNAEAGPPPFAWHDEAAVAALVEPHGFAVTVTEEALAFGADSPEAFLSDQFSNHPMWLAAQAALEPDELAALETRVLRLLGDANEEAGRFRVTSRYALVTARRDG